MSRELFKKLLIFPCVLALVGVYLIGLNLYNRKDRVDDVKEKTMVMTQASEKSTDTEKTETSDTVHEKVNINTATLEELVEIKGIGKTLAERIIEKRNKDGRFSSTESLMDVEGIGKSTYEKIKDYVTVE